MRPSRVKVTANCACGSTQQVRKDTHDANVRRNGVYLCHRCATIKAGKDGKYSHTKELRSAQSKALWQRPEFRQKVTAASASANATLAYKEAQAARSLRLWQNPDYARHVTEAVKRVMSDQIVRDKVSAGLRTKWESEQYRTAVIGNLGRHKVSSIQRMLYDMLDAIGVDYHKEGPETTIGHYAFDCLVHGQNTNILIECQGDYWHSLPKAIRNDRAKFTYISRYFPEYEIMYVWEHEFYAKDRVLDRLKLKLGVAVETVEFAFGSVVVRDMPYAEADAFLTNYHYLSKARGGKAIGAYHNGNLIACVIFSPPIRQNVAAQFGQQVTELSRFCIHPSYHKRNFATWFIARAMGFVSGPIVAYADTTVGHIGTIYKAANFRHHHSTDADYWYVDRDGFVMHKKTLYNRASNLGMTEAQFASEHGYTKKYGGIKHCYVFGLQ